MDYSPFYCKNFYKERRKRAKELRAASPGIRASFTSLQASLCADCPNPGEPAPVTAPVADPTAVPHQVKILPKRRAGAKSKKVKGFFVAVLILLCFGIITVSADLFSGGAVMSKLSETFGSDYAGKHYFIVQGGYPAKTTAEAEALAARKSGAAGYIYNQNGNYYVVLASYADKKDAESVKSKNNGVEILEIVMRMPENNNLSANQKRVCENALNLVLKDIDNLYALIDQVAKGVISPQTAHAELYDMRNELLLAKEDLINAGLDTPTRNAYLNIIDPVFGGLDAIVFKQPDENFLAEMRYVLISAIVAFG